MIARDGSITVGMLHDYEIRYITSQAVYQAVMRHHDYDHRVWVNPSIDKVIKAFVRDPKQASYIIPPSESSGIKPLQSNTIPLLKAVTLYPTRDANYGETIDQHLRRRHPAFFNTICHEGQSSVENIKRIAQVMLSVLSDIQKVHPDSEAIYRPEVGVEIKLPILSVEGYHAGMRVKLVLSKPFSHCLGLGPFEPNTCLVARSLYEI